LREVTELPNPEGERAKVVQSRLKATWRLGDGTEKLSRSPAFIQRFRGSTYSFQFWSSDTPDQLIPTDR